MKAEEFLIEFKDFWIHNEENLDIKKLYKGRT